MFENELQDLRRHKWRVDTPTRALFTADDARAFLHDVGFCLEYPLRTPVVAPTFIGAVIGSDQNLPTAKYAFVHPRANEAAELKQRLLQEKDAYEAGFGEETSLLVSAQEFPYFYALLGDRNPKLPPSAGDRGEKALLRHTFELVAKHGPATEKQLRDLLGETVSDVALTRTLHALWTKLRIVRVADDKWDLLLRWAPEMVNQGKQISAQEALSALLSKYLEIGVAVEQKDVEEFFGHLVARSRVAEVIKALSAAREIGFISVSGKTLLRNVPRISEEEKAAKKMAAASGPKRPWQPRPPRGEAPRTARNREWSKYGPPRERSERRALESGRPWQKRVEGESRPPREWKKREGAPDAKPWQKRADGESRSPREWKKREGGVGAKPWQKRTEGESRPPREWKKREGGPGVKPWQKRADGESRPAREWKKREGAPDAKPWQKRSEGKARPTREWKKPERKFAGKRPWQKAENREGAPAKRGFKKPAQGAGFKKSFKKSAKSAFRTKPAGRRPS